MSAELIGIIAVGVALAGIVLNSFQSLKQDIRHISTFIKLEAEARKKRKGLWK